jgi:VWFA-related protein
MRRGFHILLLLTLCLGLDNPVAVAQDEPAPFPGLFSEVLDVRVINVEIIVTDRNGTPITGLTPDDFKLFVDDEQIPIDYFTEVRGGVALDEPSTASIAGIPSVAPGEPVGTSYLVFIDDFFSIKRDRNLVLEALEAEAVRMQPEDRMAIVAFDGTDLEMLSSWTSSYTAVERVFEAAMERPALGLHRLVERRQFEVEAGQSLDELVGMSEEIIANPFSERPLFARRLEPQEKAYLSRLSQQINRSVAAATATLRSFAMPPGRKVMILLSGGWPFIPADYIVGDVTRALFGEEGPYGRNLYGRLAETANLLGYTLYPVDVPGLDREFEGSAEFARLPRATGSFDRGFVREDSVQATLRYLASETGGQALINSEREDVFPAVVADTRSYYWLGFSPVRGRDDESHDLRVELSSPEFRSRVRSGFLDSSAATEVNMAVESTLLFGNAEASTSLSVAVGAPEPAQSRRMEVPLRISFDLDEITFLPLGEEYIAQLELRIAVLDSKGQQAPIPIIPMALRVPELPEPGSRGTYDTRLLLRRLPHEAVAAIHDPASGRILTTGFAIAP